MKRRKFIKLLGMMATFPVAIASALRKPPVKYRTFLTSPENLIESGPKILAGDLLVKGDQHCLSCQKWICWSSVPVTNRVLCEECCAKYQHFKYAFSLKDYWQYRQMEIK